MLRVESAVYSAMRTLAREYTGGYHHLSVIDAYEGTLQMRRREIAPYLRYQGMKEAEGSPSGLEQIARFAGNEFYLD